MNFDSSLQTSEDQLSGYLKTILEVLHSAVAHDLLTPVQLTAVLIQLVDLKTKPELETKIAQLCEKYPVLSDISFNESAKSKSDLDNQTQLLISSLIRSGKAELANKMNSELSQVSKSPVQVQEIITKYSKF
jgi:hypothetical protein